MGVSSFVFSIAVFKSEAEKCSQTDDKTDFRVKWHLKVNHFRVTGKPIRHVMTPHNDISFNFNASEDMATENRRF